MVLLSEACLYASLAPPGAMACDAGGGAFRPQWRKGPVRTRSEYQNPAHKKRLDNTYLRSRITHVCSRRPNGRTQINQARIANHGGALDSRPGLHSRHSGNVPAKTQASLYDRPDNRVPAGSEESRAARKEGRQLPHFRGRRLPHYPAAAVCRRPARAVRWAHAALNGASHRIRKTHTPGREGS